MSSNLYDGNPYTQKVAFLSYIEMCSKSPFANKD